MLSFNCKIIIQVFNLYFKREISRYSAASTSNAVYIIGGHNGSLRIDTIAVFQNNQWRPEVLGRLTKARQGHGSIAVGNHIMVIGGESNDRS